MKKFDRLPPEKRKEEIQAAALKLFNEKGFAATTMENIIEKVSLSKGGVYRLYSSTTAILEDLMINGMRLRNAFYAEMVNKEKRNDKELSITFIIDMICDSLMLYPEFSKVYVEFLWEKQRNKELEECYERICDITIKETTKLIKSNGAQDILLSDYRTLSEITELMNASILSIHVLNLNDYFNDHKEQIRDAFLKIITK